jgi:hypothetical protein
MIMKPNFLGQAIRAICGPCAYDLDATTIIKWRTPDVVQPSQEDIDAKIVELEAEWTANEYARNRASEYPSLLELTVALYDTDDKSAVEAKRAAVKAKYPKPS